MGFFKKIGKSIKKNVSFKNLVKFTTPLLGSIPFVGGAVQSQVQGIQDQKEAQKAQQQYDAQMAQQQSQPMPSIVQAVSAGAGQTFGSAVMQGVNDGMSKSFVDGSAQIGSNLMTATIKAWFVKNWKILAGVTAGIVTLYYIMRKKGTSRTPIKRRY